MSSDSRGSSDGSPWVPMALLAWTRDLLASEVRSPVDRAALLHRAGLDESRP